MKFLLTRTSLWDPTIENLDVDTSKYKLTEEKYDEIDRRACKTFEEFDKKFGGLHKNFIDNGTDHKVTKNGIERTFKNGAEGVFIEINSLEELVKFKNDYGNLIIKKSWANPNILEIEIYDDYRE